MRDASLDLFELRGKRSKTQLRGLRLLAVGLMGLTMLSPPLPAQPASVYKITMTLPGTMGVTTLGCNAEGYVLATFFNNGLTGESSESSPPAPDLMFNFLTDVAWARKYDAGRGFAGTFNGCFGETFANSSTGNLGFHGALFIGFANPKKGVSTISIKRYFDYYVTAGNDIREHFMLVGGNIPFPAWTGGNISGRVHGTFTFAYYLKEGHNIISPYVPIGERDLDFNLAIEKVQ